MPDPGDSFDAIVIGGGSGGLAFAKEAAGLGARVALIERDALGGTCVNRGCVPKKLMWQAANWLHEGQKMSEVGLTMPPEFDFARLKARIASKIAGIRDDHENSLSDVGVVRFRGEAAIQDANHVSINAKVLTTEKIIVATGARPMELDISGSELAETSNDVFGWTTPPAQLVILGGGYIGCEMASIFSAFGTEVTIIDPSDRLLSPFDADLAKAARETLEALGVAVVLEEKPKTLEAVESRVAVTTDAGRRLTSDRVLNATGRTPNVDALGAMTEHLKKAGSGALAIDDRLQTNIPGVYAIGDAADRLPLTPVATRDGTDLAHILFGHPRDLVDLDHIAQAAFLIPPVAQVGTPDSDAKRGKRLTDGVTTPEGRAKTLYKVAHDQGWVSGLAISGEHAAELVSLGGALLGTPSKSLTSTEGVHPSFAEELTGR